MVLRLILIVILFLSVSFVEAQIKNYKKDIDSSKILVDEGVKFVLLEYRRLKSKKDEGSFFLKGTNKEVLLTREEEYLIFKKGRYYLLPINSI